MYKKLFGILVGITIFLFFVSVSLNLNTHPGKISPEISISSISPFGSKFGKVVAASCGFAGAGHKSEDYTSCNTAVYTCPDGSTTLDVGTSLCGGACQALLSAVNPSASCTSTCSGGESFLCESVCTYSCPTGYSGVETQVSNNFSNSCKLINSPCVQCSQGITPSVNYSGHQIIVNNIYYYTNSTGRPTPSYSLGSCPTALPANIQRIVEVQRVSSDGTNTGSWTENYDTNKTVWSGQSTKTYPYNEYLRIRAGYWNTTTGTYVSQGPWVQADAAVLHPNYGLPCSKTDNCGVTTNGTYDVAGVCNATEATYGSCDKTNICGQTFSGSQCPSGCSADNTFTNNSCITDFTPSTSQINPNGSIEFSWSVQNSSSTPKCSFVDLTAIGNPRPIPGLQNLDPSTDKARITNIQASTRFCLVCQFYNNITGSLIGEAVKHQWVRVQRIGEN